MTKCHLTIVCVTLLLLGGCKPQPQGPSLSELGAHAQGTRFARFETYAQSLEGMPLDEVMQRQEEMLSAAEQDSAEWEMVTQLQDKFFMDPNSPYRNEEYYIPVVEHLLSSPRTSETMRERARWVAPRILLNRLGQPAADFPFTLKNGRSTTLYAAIDSRPVAPRLILLFFSNPGCPNCKEITEALADDPEVSRQIASGELLVVNIHPDEDLEEWLEYLPHYPDTWICGYDPQQILHSDTLYWIRAIPSLYLLDREKRVVRKDAPLEVILKDCKQR